MGAKAIITGRKNGWLGRLPRDQAMTAVSSPRTSSSPSSPAAPKDGNAASGMRDRQQAHRAPRLGPDGQGPANQYGEDGLTDV